MQATRPSCHSPRVLAARGMRGITQCGEYGLTRAFTIGYKRKHWQTIAMKRKSQARNDSPGTSLSSLSLAHGKRAACGGCSDGHGPGHGTLMVLPLDQGLEHGPTDFFPNPPALDTSYQFRLAVEGRFSAIALGVGLAEKYMRDYAGRIPLILKLNGKTNIADDAEAVSPAFASVEDAVRLGGRGRVHGVRGVAAAGRGDPRVRQGPAGVRALRHAPRRVGLPPRPRHRGEGRQGRSTLRTTRRGSRRSWARTS